MKIIYTFSLLFLFQCSSSCNQPVKLPADSAPMQKTDKTGIANLVFRSTDGGQTWQDISYGLPKPVQDEYSVGKEFFFTDDNGLWLTAGNMLYHNKPTDVTSFWEKGIVPNEHNNIAPGKVGMFAYNYWGAGIFQKTNGTDVWSPVFTNLQEKRVSNVFETAGGSVFVCSDRGLFKSTNNGASWKQLSAGGLGKTVVSNGVLLTTSQRGILRSTDDGETWALVISEGGVGIDVACIEGGFAAITCSTVSKTRRIRTSYDGGKTWQAIDAGLQATGFIDSVLPPVNANIAAQGFSDSAQHAKDTTPMAEQMYITTIIQVGENFFCGHTDGIYKSADKGKTWKLILPAAKGKMFKLAVSGNVIYGIQTLSHC